MAKIRWKAVQPNLEDLRRVLFYPCLRKRHGLSNQEIALFVDSLAHTAQLTAGTLEVDAVAADPADNKILACAVGSLKIKSNSQLRIYSIGASIEEQLVVSN